MVVDPFWAAVGVVACAIVAFWCFKQCFKYAGDTEMGVFGMVFLILGATAVVLGFVLLIALFTVVSPGP